MPAPELLLAALVCTSIFALGGIWFGHFELETPRWRRSLKLALFLAITLGLTAGLGLATGLGFVALASVAGLSIHFVWCRKHGIDPWTAEPREEYRRLRRWRA
ncbi:MAG: hypothetical protein ACREQY_02665 [Candidatus Binatia bacterium]